MSAEESNTDSDNSNDEVSSEEDVADDKQRKPSQKKKIFVRPPSWRSDKYNNILHKLDRKSRRRASPTSKAMERHRFEGPVITCEPPECAFNWMVKEHN